MLKMLKKFLFLVLLSATSLAACQPKQAEEKKVAYDDYGQKKHQKKKHRHDRNDEQNSQNISDNPSQVAISQGNVPDKALKVLAYVRKNNQAMDGYVGGRRFGNYEGLLPKKDERGASVNYQEWDVNPKQQGRNRGKERLITSPQKAYYTNDHYRSFTQVKE